jgi:hypothetical protein
LVLQRAKQNHAPHRTARRAIAADGLLRVAVCVVLSVKACDNFICSVSSSSLSSKCDPDITISMISMITAQCALCFALLSLTLLCLVNQRAAHTLADAIAGLSQAAAAAVFDLVNLAAAL